MLCALLRSRPSAGINGIAAARIVAARMKLVVGQGVNEKLKVIQFDIGDGARVPLDNLGISWVG
jgi:hypothetical protein